MAKGKPAYERLIPREASFQEARDHFSSLVGYSVHIDHNNHAMYLYQALKHANWLRRCPTCSGDTRHIPESLRRGIQALYGASLTIMKST